MTEMCLTKQPSTLQKNVMPKWSVQPRVRAFQLPLNLVKSISVCALAITVAICEEVTLQTPRIIKFHFSRLLNSVAWWCNGLE